MKKNLLQAARTLWGYRFIITLGIYALIAAACFYVAYEVRFDFTVPIIHQEERLRIIGVMVGVKLLALVLFGQAGSMLTYFSIPDFIRLSLALFTSSVLMIVPRFTPYSQFTPPRGVLLVDLLLSIAAFCAFRVMLRLYRERLMVGRKLKGGDIGKR